MRRSLPKSEFQQRVSGRAPITGSPELHSIEQVQLCCFGSAHNVAHRHQRAGVQLARTLHGGVQHHSEEHGELGRDREEQRSQCEALTPGGTADLCHTCLWLQVLMAPTAAMLLRSVRRRLLSSSIDISTVIPPS